MRAGIFVAYWPWFTPEEQVSLAVLADELGLDSVWVAEAWGQDAVSVLGFLAAKTERIALGSALFQIPARQPTATAMAAVSLDVLSRRALPARPRRVRPAGLRGLVRRPVRAAGVADARVRRDRPPRAGARGAAGVLRPRVHAAARGRHRAGQAAEAAGQAGPGADPVYLGAVGPKAVEQVGEIADGWLPFLCDPAQFSVLMEPLRRGLEKAGRDLGDLDVAVAVPMGLSDDVGAARDAVRPWLAFYVGAMGAKDKNFYVELAERSGHGDAARAVQSRWLAGDRAGAVGELTDELVDAMALACTPAQLDDRLAAYADVGVTTLVAVPCGPDKPAIVRALAAATVARV